MANVVINGQAGRIEAKYHVSNPHGAPIAMVLHPHPKYGGTMNNKVTYALFRSFAEQGFNVIRFNFRGVGASEGRFGDEEGELRDAATVMDWLQGQNPNARQCWVGGFSFGAWIGMQLLMRRPEITSFISVSPPTNMFDFGFLAPCPSSGLISIGEADQIVTKESVDQLIERLQGQRGISIEYLKMPEADHFYTGHIPTLMTHVQSYIQSYQQPQRMTAGRRR